MSSRRNWPRGDENNSSLPPIRTQLDEPPQRRENGPRRSLTFREPPVAHSEDSRSRRDPALPTIQRRESLMAFDPVIVKFVKNGDKFFEGVKVNVSRRGMKNWDVLLSELSNRIQLPAGVRHIYTPEHGHKVTKVSQLEHQGTYVCGSTEPFRRIDYSKLKNPDWRSPSKIRNSDSQVDSVFSRNFDPSSSMRSTRGRLSLSMNSSMSENHLPLRRHPRKLRPMRQVSLSAPDETLENYDYRDQRLKLPDQNTANDKSMEQNAVNITIFRNGPLPRERINIHLATGDTSWEDVKKMISERLLTINGCLRLFNLNGDQVRSLDDLWRAGTILIAAGAEKFDIAYFLSGETGRNTDPKPPINSSADQSCTETKEQTTIPEQAKFSPHKAHFTEDISPTKELDSTTSDEQYSDNFSTDTNEEDQTNITNTEKQTEIITDHDSKSPSPAKNKALKVTVSDQVHPIESNSSFDAQSPPIPSTNTHTISPHEEIERRPRTLSLISDKYSDLRSFDRPGSVYSSSDEIDTPQLDVQKNYMPLDKGFPQHVVLPQTPQSEMSIGMGGPQSMIDMMLPKLIRLREDSEQSTGSLSSSSLRSQADRKRSIGIQTEFVFDQLSTIIDVNNQTIDHTEELHPDTSPQDTTNQTSSTHYTWEQTVTINGECIREYDHQTNKLTREKYHVGLTMNEGRFTSVKTCNSKADKKDYFLRVINKAKVFWNDDLILREVRIMTKLKHENIMQVIDQWESSDEICMVMEQTEGSDLYDCIHHCQSLCEEDTIQVMKQLGLALVYLHANRIVHRDIRPENIFLVLRKNEGWILKLGGFSLATNVTETLSLICGKEYYRSPEMITGTGYGTKLDVWAAGVICYLLLSGTMPFGRKSQTNLFANNTTAGKFSFPSNYWKNVSEGAKDFIRQLLKPKPCHRYSSSEMLQHQWIFTEQQTSERETSIKKSQRLMEHIAAQAAENIASVLVLNVTALDHRPRN